MSRHVVPTFGVRRVDRALHMRPFRATRTRRRTAWKSAIALLLTVFAASHAGMPAWAGVLEKDDLDRVASIKTNFTTIIVDMSEAQRRPDLTESDRECMKTIAQDLFQISQELSGYESLIKIESQLNFYSDERTTREVVLFALNKASDVLNGERTRLAHPPDQCARLPNPTAKAKSVLQVIEATITIIENIRSKL